MKLPKSGVQERCYYHDIRADENGIAVVGVDNPAEKIGVRIRYDKKVLPRFVQWRMLGSGEYVTGLEPTNLLLGARAKARSEGIRPLLEPGEKVVYNFEIEAFDL